MSEKDDGFWKNRKKYLKSRDQYGNLTMGKIDAIEKLKDTYSVQREEGVGNFEKHTCDVCNYTGKGYTFVQNHFENCKYNQVDLDKLIEDLKITPISLVLKTFEEKGIDLFKRQDFEKLVKSQNISPKRKYLCPNCDLKGNSSFFISNHYDNCVFKDLDLDKIKTFYTNQPSRKSAVKNTSVEFGIPHHIMSKWLRTHKVKPPKELLNKHTCPNCNVEGKGSNFLLRHFDNCWINNLSKDELTQFKQDIHLYSVSSISKRYDISYLNVQKYFQTHNIPCDPKTLIKCPFCNYTGKGPRFYTDHMGNCPLRNSSFSLNEVVNELKQSSIKDCVSKFSLKPTFLKQIKDHN